LFGCFTFVYLSSEGIAQVNDTLELILEGIRFQKSLITSGKVRYIRRQQWSERMASLIEEGVIKVEDFKEIPFRALLPWTKEGELMFSGTRARAHLLYRPSHERGEEEKETVCVFDEESVTEYHVGYKDADIYYRYPPLAPISLFNPIDLGRIGINLPTDRFGKPLVPNFRFLGKEEISGTSYYLIEWTYSQDDRQIHKAWIDPKRGFLAKKIEDRWREDGELISVFEIVEFEKCSCGGQEIWFAKSIREHKDYGSEGIPIVVVDTDLIEVELNIDIPDSCFTLNLPSGTRVYDHRNPKGDGILIQTIK